MQILWRMASPQFRRRHHRHRLLCSITQMSQMSLRVRRPFQFLLHHLLRFLSLKTGSQCAVQAYPNHLQQWIINNRYTIQLSLHCHRHRLLWILLPKTGFLHLPHPHRLTITIQTQHTIPRFLRSPLRHWTSLVNG